MGDDVPAQDVACHCLCEGRKRAAEIDRNVANPNPQLPLYARQCGGDETRAWRDEYAGLVLSPKLSWSLPPRCHAPPVVFCMVAASTASVSQ